jgi:hypothetical protein
MAPHLQRLVKERSELGDKIALLALYVDGYSFRSLPANEQALLTRQLAVMGEYRGILDQRIKGFQ